MKTTVPWSLDGFSDDARGPPPVTARPASAAGRTAASDHAADMAAIAAELGRLQKSAEAGRPGERRGRARPDAQLLVRDAVAEIARRQADLDRHGGAPGEDARVGPSLDGTVAVDGARLRDAPGRDAPAWSPPAAEPTLPTPGHRPAAAPSGPVRTGVDFAAEVSATFARFSQDLHAAIKATDARPKVEELGRQVSRIGEAVEGLAKPEAPPIGRDRTRDPLPPAGDRPVPLQAADRPAGAPPPDYADTLDEVRRLLQGLDPRATATSLESRLDDFTARIERGLEAGHSVELIENLSRRVDEVHSSLRSELAKSAVDTGPLEGLVRNLSERLGQARAASVDFEQLEVAVRDVSAKIDAGGSDPRAIRAVEAQLTRLAERLDRSEASLKTLDGVEHALGELFSQFEVTRQVAIDAAETAARTAARDTLREALQSPGLTQRGADANAGLVEQVARGLEDLRVSQGSSELRTQTMLSDLRSMMERLLQDAPEPGAALRQQGTGDEPRRRRPAIEPVAAVQAFADPAALLIEPGHGRNPAPRTEPRLSPEPAVDPAPSATATDADGPAGFIAAARRAAQVAQASAASAAALKDADRNPQQRPPSARAGKAGPRAPWATSGTMARAGAFLTRRRRPILLGLAAIVLLVGALEVVKLGIAPVEGPRVGTSDSAAPSPVRMATADTPANGASTVAAKPAAATPDAVLPPATVPAPPPLPTFVAGATKAPAPVEGIGEGLRSAAASGDAAAQYEVGLRYAEGRGVTRDARQALAWFDKAAAQGSAPAQYRLGSAYEKGVGVDRDPALAVSWYAKAAGAGNIRAMHNLAVMSAEGAAGKPDYTKAAQWFGKASSYGVRDSQFNLAILYARGLGIEQSLGQSYKWFAVAAAQGDDDSAKKRDEVAAKLDPAALTAAKAAAESYRAATPPAAANEVSPPPGGWDAPASRPAGAASSRVSQL